MKKLTIVLSVVCAAMVLFATDATAQKYKASKANENWFVGVAGGVNILMDGGAKPGCGGDFEVDFGKWILPDLGFRIGYQGITSALWSDSATPFGPKLDEDKLMYNHKINFAYVHADLLWDFTNTVWGYKATRVYSCIPYGHLGYFHSYGSETFGNKGAKGQSFAGGVGLLNKFRISNITNFILDIRGTLASDRIHGHYNPDTFYQGCSGVLSIAAGLSFNLGKNGFLNQAAVAGAASAGAAAAAASALSQADKAAAEKAAKVAGECNESGKTPAEKAAKAATILLKNQPYTPCTCGRSK